MREIDCLWIHLQWALSAIFLEQVLTWLFYRPSSQREIHGHYQLCHHLYARAHVRHTFSFLLGRGVMRQKYGALDPFWWHIIECTQNRPHPSWFLVLWPRTLYWRRLCSYYFFIRYFCFATCIAKRTSLFASSLSPNSLESAYSIFASHTTQNTSCFVCSSRCSNCESVNPIAFAIFRYTSELFVVRVPSTDDIYVSGSFERFATSFQESSRMNISRFKFFARAIASSFSSMSLLGMGFGIYNRITMLI